ncbi:unnamed protein product [Ceratitis capitata]|uniref:(Mediterranean fruit fly) hypothetical protein n=1 Tax=Ceratitis capitata TaxID=7213 RepID=A0A811V6K8_CERCA|nr:unnamed protein product [Ceratitis capitata]
MSECANQCEYTCDYYGSILRKRGLCQKGEHCKRGCVDKRRPDCHAIDKYWRDEDTCVEMDQCPCMDKSEKYVQPHMLVTAYDEVCRASTTRTLVCRIKCLNCVTHITTPNQLTKNMNQTLYHHVGATSAVRVRTLRATYTGRKPLADSAFNASSTSNAYNAPYMARLPENPKDSIAAGRPA